MADIVIFTKQDARRYRRRLWLKKRPVLLDEADRGRRLQVDLLPYCALDLLRDFESKQDEVFVAGGQVIIVATSRELPEVERDLIDYTLLRDVAVTMFHEQRLEPADMFMRRQDDNSCDEMFRPWG
jgi:hypothetical protein